LHLPPHSPRRLLFERFDNDDIGDDCDRVDAPGAYPEQYRRCGIDGIVIPRPPSSCKRR
jgi:hypothetical protein